MDVHLEGNVAQLFGDSPLSRKTVFYYFSVPLTSLKYNTIYVNYSRNREQLTKERVCAALFVHLYKRIIKKLNC